ncbi:hypothetical protein CNBG_0670 [Cryptococcus deuterogattii R265]|uniref:SEC7 domain-containing protein n=1 Tax=Cryptococcus deuterogattii (strain R265) TaxID=294750 RepID=A0A095C2E9_CRYD2|nr:hypothetical protein CNBG_0670 [Cryptococcus deuterogattii R265]KIR75734.1 hypothetical protein I310_00431 [Cryptococcus deuterogattii CA1014]
MSTSPKYYHASCSSSHSASRQDDRPPSPQTRAQVRSEAIARLKRAASLPRSPDGRRPLQRHAAARTDDHGGDAEGSPGIMPVPVEVSNLLRPGSPSRSAKDEQEVLSPSPVQIAFDHARIYSSVDHMQMQRSASASPSYNMTCNDYPPPTNGVNPEWHTMQLAQSYLPSLAPHSSNSLQQQVPLAGRNTPSPLPTLGELRTLQRSNSQAARARAMSKLTGGTGISMNDDVSLHLPLSGSLQRAGTLGASANPMLSMPSRTGAELSTPSAQDPRQSTAFDAPRPRLQRSFTVSSSNMGEERRSAVGRRMVERLAERRAARQKEEEEVRRLWEERKAAANLIGKGQAHVIDRPGKEEQERHQVTPSVSKPSGDDEPPIRAAATAAPNMLLAPERPVSGGTMQSAQFEYEDHLRRSLSSRTARGAMGAVSEPVPAVTMPNVQSEATNQDTEQLDTPTLPQNPMSPYPESQAFGASVLDLDEPLLPPHPPFITPSRHIAHDSTSTIHGSNNSPGSSSTLGGSSILSGLDSMMFVTGGTGGHYAQLASQGETNWPVEAAESSDWGTPGKEIRQTNLISSPSSSTRIDRPPSSNSEIFSTQISETGGTENGHYSPKSHDPYGTPSTESAMPSWEEVSRKEEQVSKAPVSHSYHARSESVGARMKRTMKSAMRKGSQSQSSMTSASPPMSSRRGSGVSAAPSQGSAAKSWPKGEPVAITRIAIHHPSISSLSAFQADSAVASSSSLIQHQLSSGPSQVSLLPRANLNDPRIHISKLSPFPGLEHLESRAAGYEGFPAEKPKLVQQVSDSVIPSHTSALTPGGTFATENIYALPLVARPEPNKRLSDESVTKRNWLAKALTPRTSLSRKISYGDVRSRGNSLGQGAMVISSDVDPFASPPRRAVPTSSAPSIPSSMSPDGKPRAASPTVSAVPEMSEDGTRATRPIHLRQGGNAPGIMQERIQMRKEAMLPKKTLDILRRMDEVLTLGPEHPARPEMLDDPPRKFLKSSQILQVVNANIVKDRFLFLFTDLLVIAKPVLAHNVHATLDTQFIVKNVVSLDKLVISGAQGESHAYSGRQLVVDNFVDKFKQDPVEACRYLVQNCSPKMDLATLAGLILKTSELDKTQVGLLLANNEGLTRAFVDRFHFRNIRIDDALRIFLLSLRLPTDPISCETLLKVFAERYYVANHEHLTYNQELAIELVLTIMQFDDALYSTFDSASANDVITLETFVTAFRSKDPLGLVPDDLLSQIYMSLHWVRLSQALASSEVRFERRAIATLPHTSTKLTYNVWSEKIYISIPAPDSKLRIKLLGAGLEFDPPELDFTNKTEESFRVKGISLGMKTLLFVRVGDNAALYASLGSIRHFNVERAFMRHTFQIAFSNHVGLKRKYCFSMNSFASCQEWRELLEKHIRETKGAKSIKGSSSRDVARQAAEAVSLQVLRDALISTEETAQLTKENTAFRPRGNAAAQPESDTGPRSRTGSISAVYAQHALKEEYELVPRQPVQEENDMDKASQKGNARTGKELVLLCRQNSLMPWLLNLLLAGAGYEPGDGYAHEGSVDRDANVLQSKGKRV